MRRDEARRRSSKTQTGCQAGLGEQERPGAHQENIRSTKQEQEPPHTTTLLGGTAPSVLCLRLHLKSFCLSPLAARLIDGHR